MKHSSIYVIIIILCYNLLNSANKYNNSYEYYLQPFDVISYSLKFDVSGANDIKNQNVLGVNKIHIKWNDIDSNNNFYFNLVSLHIDSIFNYDKRIDYSENVSKEPLEQYYFIKKSDTLSESQLTIYYSGSMKSEGGSMDWGGVHYSSNILFNMGASFLDPNVSAARYWMPCYDHPQDKALFEAEFITPASITVASNGRLIEETVVESKKITKWKQIVPSATYLMNFAMSNFAKIEDSISAIPSIIYCYNIDSSQSKVAYSNIQEMAKYFSTQYSPYPFEKIGYVNTPIGSMEHQTMISFARGIAVNAGATKDSNNLTIVHELAHSWFGNMVTPKDFRDVWFNEALASHSEAVWANYMKNNYTWYSNSYNNVISQMWNSYLNDIASTESILPLYNFKNYNQLEDHISYNSKVYNYPTTIYYKGATIVNHLRNELGHNKFDNAIRLILEDFKNKNISTYELKNELEKYTNSNLDTFFNEWVYQKGFPILNINYYLDNNLFKLDIKQIQNESLYGKYSKVKIPVTIHTLANEYIKYYYIYNSEEIIIDSINSNEIISSIEINNNKHEISPIKYNLKLVSVDDNYLQYMPKVYNNNNNITIDMGLECNIKVLELVDLLGRTYKNDFLINHNLIFINKSSLLPGMYVLKITSNLNKLTTIKIII